MFSFRISWLMRGGEQGVLVDLGIDPLSLSGNRINSGTSGAEKTFCDRLGHGFTSSRTISEFVSVPSSGVPVLRSHFCDTKSGDKKFEFGRGGGSTRAASSIETPRIPPEDNSFAAWP